MPIKVIALIVGIAAMAGQTAVMAGDQPMGFFVTSQGLGDGGNLGGLAGADAHCARLAAAAGSKLVDPNVVHARDRIGAGPWHNAQGIMVAKSVDDLHSANNNLNKETALDENGQMVNGRSEKPNKHDILTGSRPDGTAFAGAFFPDMTCGNWTKNGAEGAAMVGHHDRAGPIDHPWARSWNTAHPTVGCTQENVRKTGGDGLFYCFAAD